MTRSHVGEAPLQGPNSWERPEALSPMALKGMNLANNVMTSADPSPVRSPDEPLAEASTAPAILGGPEVRTRVNLCVQMSDHQNVSWHTRAVLKLLDQGWFLV